MDTKSRRFSHSIITKVIVFVIVILCFTQTLFVTITLVYNGNLVFEDNYYQSLDFDNVKGDFIGYPTLILNNYNNKSNILNGGTITQNKIKKKEEELFNKFKDSENYDYNLSDVDNYIKFKEEYSDELNKIKDQLIKEDLRWHDFYLQQLSNYKGIYYYVSDGTNEISNTPNKNKDYFKSFASFMIFENYDKEVYPNEEKTYTEYERDLTLGANIDLTNYTIYVGFSDEFLKPRINEWNEKREISNNRLYSALSYLVGLILSFIYLIYLIGKKSRKDKEIHMNFVDRIYNEIKLGLCIMLIALWFGLMELLYGHLLHLQYYNIMYFSLTAIIASIGLILVLSLVKHIKNRTFIKHTLIYTIFYKIIKFSKHIYHNGNIGIRIISANKFNTINEGVEKIKNGDIHHSIDIPNNGELGKLATNINGITDGLKEVVDKELKSERLKTELITNVSHDIRTPLTSIITYVDLLKNEKDESKSREYIKILEQKSQRLKVLTDDLFEAAKASSGDIPVNYKKIDIVSLITQGLGELNDKIKESKLEFKINCPDDKVYITGDGKLLWRVMENLLSNIFKYALKGSRIYIDILNKDKEVMLVIKNISANELNISADELMERFKRGDKSRSSKGSGLGLSISKSLIEIQKGKFNIEIDGDLFKVIIQMPKQCEEKTI